MGGTGGDDCGDVLEDLLKPTCATMFCHSTAAMGPLDLESDDFGARAIGKPGSSGCEDYVHIDADNPEDSLIYSKLSDPPPCGGRMPFLGEEFTDAEKACVLEYIEQVVADQ
jgi:hypothetical protein